MRGRPGRMFPHDGRYCRDYRRRLATVRADTVLIMAAMVPATRSAYYAERCLRQVCRGR